VEKGHFGRAIETGFLQPVPSHPKPENKTSHLHVGYFGVYLLEIHAVAFWVFCLGSMTGKKK